MAQCQITVNGEILHPFFPGDEQVFYFLQAGWAT